MTIMTMIKEDNAELLNRLREYVELSRDEQADRLADIRLWCLDAASSELGKEKAIYRKLDEAKSSVADLDQRLSVVRKSSLDFRKAVEEIFAREPGDNTWDVWMTSALNALDAQIREENMLLELFPQIFSEKALNRLTTEFENARESHEDIGQFQYFSAPGRARPSPSDGR